MGGLVGLAAHSPVVFPIHPRTRARLVEDGGLERLEAAGVACIEPVGYLEFLSLQAGAGAIVTDSGGVQEEASALGVSCFTFRPNTERPITLTHGTNVLLGDDPAEIAEVRPSPHPPTPVRHPAVGRPRRRAGGRRAGGELRAQRRHRRRRRAHLSPGTKKSGLAGPDFACPGGGRLSGLLAFEATAV